MSKDRYESKNRTLPLIIFLMIIAIIAVLMFMLPGDMIQSILPKEAVSVIEDVKSFITGTVKDTVGVDLQQEEADPVKKHYAKENEPEKETQEEDEEKTQIGEAAAVAYIMESLDQGLTSIEFENVSAEAVKNAVKQIYRMPYYFWIGREYTIKTTGDKSVLELTAVFEDIEGAKAQINAAAELIIGQVSEEESDYRKVRAVYDGIINYISYNRGEPKQNDYNIYGALAEGSCVCEGYAKTFVYLCEKLGINANIYTGNAVTNEGKVESHAWNSAYLYGQLYYFDVTWGDQDDGQIYYDWFALTSEQIERSHFSDEESPMPEAYATDCNYYYLNDMVLTGSDRELFSKMISEQGKEVHILCADSQIYEEICGYMADPSTMSEICANAGIYISGYSYSKNDSIYTLKISFY